MARDPDGLSLRPVPFSWLASGEFGVWSERILGELERNLIEDGLTPEQAARQLGRCARPSPHPQCRKRRSRGLREQCQPSGEGARALAA